MTDRAFFTMCATTFAPDRAFDKNAMRDYLRRQVDAGLGVYLGSAGNGETHAMTPDELHRLYAVGTEVCKGRVPLHAILPEEHTAEATIAQARIAIDAGIEMLHLYTLEGRHGYRPTDPELIGYFDDVLAVIDHPVMIAVNPLMGYLPRPAVVAEICRRHPQIRGVRLSGQRNITLINLIDMLGRDIQYHWLLDSGALDPLVQGAMLFSVEANIIPRTFRRLIDLYEAGRLDAIGAVLADISRFNQLITQYGPCARWIKMCMQILKLPGHEGGLRKPYLMPPADEMRRFADALLALGNPEIEEMARAVGLPSSARPRAAAGPEP